MAQMQMQRNKISNTEKNTESPQDIIRNLLSENRELKLIISNHNSDISKFNNSYQIQPHPLDLNNNAVSMKLVMSAMSKSFHEKKLRRLHRLSIELDAPIFREVLIKYFS